MLHVLDKVTPAEIELPCRSRRNARKPSAFPAEHQFNVAEAGRAAKTSKQHEERRSCVCNSSIWSFDGLRELQGDNEPIYVLTQNPELFPPFILCHTVDAPGLTARMPALL